MTPEDKRYNGWANYETWLVALWLDNDQGTHEATRDLVQQAFICADGPNEFNKAWYTREGAEAHWLEDALKDWIEDPENGLLPDLGASMAADLMGAALSEVNWRELAEHYLADAERPEEDSNAS